MKSSWLPVLSTFLPLQVCLYVLPANLIPGYCMCLRWSRHAVKCLSVLQRCHREAGVGWTFGWEHDCYYRPEANRVEYRLVNCGKAPHFFKAWFPYNRNYPLTAVSRRCRKPGRVELNSTFPAPGTSCRQSSQMPQQNVSIKNRTTAGVPQCTAGSAYGRLTG